jgi:glutathione S-transferase
MPEAGGGAVTNSGQSSYTLYIGNKNYSSWSLRPWSLLIELGIPFQEHVVPFGDASAWQQYRSLVPSGKVPFLLDGPLHVWDSLSIIEHLHERHTGVWPQDPSARVWARSAAAEMHSGFTALRGRCPMSCGLRVRLLERPPALERDVARVGSLWSEGLQRFGGPFLAGATFSAVDAFYAPVAFRVQTYGLELPGDGQGYVTHLLRQRSLVQWYAEALAERFRDTEHEANKDQLGEVTADLRVPPEGP